MSLIPAEDLTYLDLVGEAFLAERGRALLLSPVDVELLRRYEAAAIPAPVLVRAVGQSAARRRAHGKPLPVSLTGLKRSLDAAARRFQAGQTRGAGPLPEASQLDALLAQAREAPLPEERAAYRAAYRAACQGEPLAEAAGLAWLSGLPRSLQRAVGRAVAGGLGRRLAPEAREEYRHRLRAALVAAALERAELSL